MPMLPSSSRIVRHVPARGTCDHSEPVDRVRAAPAGEPHGDGGEVHAEPALAQPAQRGEMAARAAAEVEHRRLDAARGSRCRSRRRAPASGPAAAARAARRRAAAARAAPGRCRAGAAPPRPAGARRARRRGSRRADGGANAAAVARRSRSRRHPQLVGDHGELGREARVRRLGGDRPRVLEGVDVAQRRQDRRAQAEDRPAARAGPRRCAASSSGRRRTRRGSGVRRPIAQ